MNYNSIPIPTALYIDDDNDPESIRYQHIARTNNQLMFPGEMSNQTEKKRKLVNRPVETNPSNISWKKRYRFDPMAQRSISHLAEMAPEPEPIILDEDEQTPEDSEIQSFRAFDWTIEPKRTNPPTFPKTIPRIATAEIPTMRSFHPKIPDRNDLAFLSTVQNSNERIIQQTRKPVSLPVTQPSVVPTLNLPLPKPTSSIARSATRRGRPVKDTRAASTHITSPPSSVRTRPESSIPIPTTKPVHENRRPLIHGTGLLSAFHDSKYYRCNICRFKSVTSATLLQHLFTHVFFCPQCSFYSYSHHQLFQHIFDKHDHRTIEDISESVNPKSFDLLYLTRCTDGTFALCMDASSNSKHSQELQPLVLSSPISVEQPTNKSLSRSLGRDDQTIKRNFTSKQTSTRVKTNEKKNRINVVMKHRRCYSLKKSPSLHSLTWEYHLCRKERIKQMYHMQKFPQKKSNRSTSNDRRLIDETSYCLRRIVNQIVEQEENSDGKALICALPNEIISSILSIDNLQQLTDSLRLRNKFDTQLQKQRSIDYDDISDQMIPQTFVLCSSEGNNNDQSVILSLHSSLTNGDSCFTETKLPKSSLYQHNSHRFLINPLVQPPTFIPEKIPHRNKTTMSSSSQSNSMPSVIPSTIPSRIDGNNNSITSGRNKLPSMSNNVIVLD